MRPTPICLWDPRTHSFEEDNEILSQEPFASVFLEYESRSYETSNSWEELSRKIGSQLRSEYWVSFIVDYFTWALGNELRSENHTDLEKQIACFIRLMWLQYRHKGSKEGQTEANACLLNLRKVLLDEKHQMPLAPAYNFSLVEQVSDNMKIPPDDNFEDSDSADDPDEDGVDDTDVDDTDDHDTDADDVDDAYTEGSISDEDMDTEESVSDEDMEEKTLELCVSNIKAFFYPCQASTSDVISEKDTTFFDARCDLAVVDDLVWMRCLRPRIYRTQAFRDEFKESGLESLFFEIGRADNLLETTHPDVQQSFRFYNWKLAYAELLCRWTPEPEPFPDHKMFRPMEVDATRKVDAETFLLFFGSRPELQPWVFNPMAAFLFVSLSAFIFHCQRWLVPCLQALGFETAGWDSTAVYRELLRLPAMQNTVEGQTLLDLLDPRLRTVIVETAWYRKMVKRVKAEVHRKPRSLSTPDETVTNTAPSNHTRPQGDTQKRRAARKRAQAKLAEEEKLATSSNLPTWQADNKCNACAQRAVEDRCVRFKVVYENLNAGKWIDHAVTSAPEGDRLEPEHSPSDQAKGRPPKEQKYATPEEIGLEYVEARPADHAVWKPDSCGRDIVRFIHWKDEEWHLVGGVSFNAFTPQTLKILQDNHRLFRVRGIRRREAMAHWGHIGSMTGVGSRMPNGGRKGDGYAPYACHRGDTPDDIKAVMRHGLDADLLIIAAKAIYPDIERDMLDVTEEAELDRLGKYGSTGYYCTNYVSCVHRDRDMLKSGRRCLHPCTQLVKENCGPNDFNFAMVRWNIAIRTQENTVWVFDGDDEHGTVMPSASAMAAGATSLGSHNTKNRRNVNRAHACQKIRQGYNLRYRAAHV